VVIQTANLRWTPLSS